MSSSVAVFRSQLLLPAVCGRWQFSQPFAATVEPLVCGHGLGAVPFQVEFDVLWLVCAQKFFTWHAVHRAVAWFDMTRNLP